MARKRVTVTEEKVKKIKEIIKQTSIQQAAKTVGVSYYTAWCVSKGKYDSDMPLSNIFNYSICPITGFKF